MTTEDSCLKFIGEVAARDRIIQLENMHRGSVARCRELETQLEGVSSALLIANKNLDVHKSDCCDEPSDADAIIEAIEIGKKWQKNSSLEEWFPMTAEAIEEIRQVATGERQVGNDDTDGLDWIARRIAALNPPDLSCGDCDPCLGGRPDQCAVMSGQHNSD